MNIRYVRVLRNMKTSLFLAMAALQQSESLAADAFRRIYPEQFLERYLAADARSDGRPLGRARQLTCAATLARRSPLASSRTRRAQRDA
jgi:hypothetical protein